MIEKEKEYCEECRFQVEYRVCFGCKYCEHPKIVQDGPFIKCEVCGSYKPSVGYV